IADGPFIFWRAYLQRFLIPTLAHENVDTVSLGPFGAEVFADEIQGALVVASLHEGCGAGPTNLGIERQGDVKLPTGFVANAGVAKNVTQQVMSDCAIRPSAHQVFCLSVRSD